MHSVVSLNADSIIIGVYYCCHLHMFDGGGAGNLWTDSKLKVCMSLLALASPLLLFLSQSLGLGQLCLVLWTR